MTQKQPDTGSESESKLDALFADARSNPEPVPDGLLKAVFGDAQRFQPKAPVGRQKRAAFRWNVPNVGALFSGWSLTAGLTACLVAGVLVGYVGPDQVTSVTSILIGDETAEISMSNGLFSLDDLLYEG